LLDAFPIPPVWVVGPRGFNHIPDFNDWAANAGLSLGFTSNNAALNAFALPRKIR
jgi:hypothetical protein